MNAMHSDFTEIIAQCIAGFFPQLIADRIWVVLSHINMTYFVVPAANQFVSSIVLLS